MENIILVEKNVPLIIVNLFKKPESGVKKHQTCSCFYFVFIKINSPLNIGHKLNVHKTFRIRPRCLLNVLCTFNPVSMSKIFERIIFRQILNYMESFLSKYQFGFQKGYSTQHCLLFMLEKWKRAVDNGKVFGILLTDLPKAFDCLSHEFLLAKLHSHGFCISALRLIYSYLANRKQRTKINPSYRSWEDILFGVTQGSILGPLLFNIFHCDMFFELSQTYFASYADGNTPYVEANNIDEVIRILENDSIQLFKWFSDNQMKANKDKCHLVIRNNEKVSM